MTQIRVTQAQRDQLNELKSVGESYADVLASEFGIGGESVYAGVELSWDDCKLPSPEEIDVDATELTPLVTPPRTFLGYFETGDSDAE